jgi:Phage integrase family
MLRHACGYALVNRGHDTRALQAYLGHRNIQRTVRHTELSPTRFKNFWRECDRRSEMAVFRLPTCARVIWAVHDRRTRVNAITVEAPAMIVVAMRSAKNSFMQIPLGLSNSS